MLTKKILLSFCLLGSMTAFAEFDGFGYDPRYDVPPPQDTYKERGKTIPAKQVIIQNRKTITALQRRVDELEERINGVTSLMEGLNATIAEMKMAEGMGGNAAVPKAPDNTQLLKELGLMIDNISANYVSKDDLKEAIGEILKLNPKPGNSLNESTRMIEHIVPDFLILHEDGELVLQLNGRNAPELRISRTYRNMLEAYAETKSSNNKQAKEAMMFVRQKIDSAKWFIDAIKQRQNTLSGTMKAIMEYQEEYFLTGDETKLRPMILKNIADIVNLDISTISRVVNSKYVQTPFGTFKLKSFFSESMQNQNGEEISTREIKKILQNIVEKENKHKPYTDDKLALFLKDKGYNIARRTISKYREQLDIPVARLRKEL